jgi:outer membrane cobalamin receptor
MKLQGLCMLLLAAVVPAFAQFNPDSVQHLHELEVVANRFSEIIPAQRLSGEQLRALTSFSVADAIRYFSGIQLKDYGGIGGLKTIDIRSMGTNHMGVFYDGIQLGNAQNGQVDLGKFSLDNVEEIALYNGQKSAVFQSAKDFSSSGTMYIRTRRPRFKTSESHHFKVVTRVGSFNLTNVTALWEQAVAPRLSSSVNAEYIRSTGNYPFRYRRWQANGNLAFDTTAIRANGDLLAMRIEAGLFGEIDEGRWYAKLYYYDSQRGIPGAIVNNVWKRAQRQWDRNFFTQTSWQKSLSEHYDLLINLKYARDFMRYLNPDTTLLYIDNSFLQQEMYLSVANKVALSSNWDVALSADWQLNALQSSMTGFVPPRRNMMLVAVASSLQLNGFKVQGSVLATHVMERLKPQSGLTDGEASLMQASKSTEVVTITPDKPKFSPSLFLSWKPFEANQLQFRTFYKHIFRMPTFNDLYYTDIGNALLKPEVTHQYNLGIQYGSDLNHSWLRHWQLQADAYYNEVSDKIIAVPKGNGMYRWMMMNLGYVEIRGLDVAASGTLQPAEEWTVYIRLSYTWQRAQDFTERKNKELQQLTLGGQIPYIPLHSGSVVAGLVYRQWRFNYSFIYVGERFHNSANIPENYEQPWYTHDCTLSREFDGQQTKTRVSLEINNLLSQDYEVVLNYPMPKRNYKLALTLEF